MGGYEGYVAYFTQLRCRGVGGEAPVRDSTPALCFMYLVGLENAVS